jgi:GT2 family glycosyltransferase
VRASVIISTYNRCDALVLSLEALGRQTVPPGEYEILVVDDGSSDATFETVRRMSPACTLRVFRQPENRGISAARNLAIGQARGRYLIFVSDDLIVPEEFIATHLATLEQHPGCWVVGGIKQLESISETPFGRYLDSLENSWEEARKTKQIAPMTWELSSPTARNLSLPRADLDQIGVFDEQFRMSCEDQDLAHKAEQIGIRFVYSAAITCLHNDQVGDFKRFCRAQVPRTRDTVLFCHKWSRFHAGAPVARLNGYITRGDDPTLVLKKVAKSILATRPAAWLLGASIWAAEQARVPDRVLWRLYRLAIGVSMFRGWREGLALVHDSKRSRHVEHIGCHPGV